MSANKHSNIHNHQHNHEINGQNLLFASILNLFITLIEFAGGLFSGSYALLSDALHNLSDTISVFIAYLSNKIGKRKPTEAKTFGFKRIEIIAALVNGIIMVVVCIYLIAGAIKRFQHPQLINTSMMVIIAAIGVLANFIAMAILFNDRENNLNIKSAYLHLMADTLSSVIVLVGGIVIYFYKIYWVDPILTIVISFFILKETWNVLYEAYLILLQATPTELDLNLVKLKIESFTEIENVHHVHAWKLDENNIHFECHIDLKDDCRISQTDEILFKLKKILKSEFNVAHTTFQFEYNSCNDKAMIH
jgi:cobalt-zinc-cadmium efflux system protein